MTAAHVTVAFGQASQRVVCPHRDASVPATDVTVEVLDEAGGTIIEAGTAATKGTFSTALSADAAIGDRSITVASTAGLALDEPIVLADAAGRTEVHEVEGFAGTTVHLKDRIGRAYPATTTTVKSALVYYTLDASDTAKWPVDVYYQAIFSCSSWGGPRGVLFRVVDLEETNPISLRDMKGWVAHLDILRDGSDSVGLNEARDAAWELIRSRLEALERDPAVWRGARQARSVGGMLAAALFLWTHGHREDAKDLAGDPLGSGGIFAMHWQDTLKAIGWFDENQDRVVDRGERVTVGSTRVGRGL